MNFISDSGVKYLTLLRLHLQHGVTEAHDTIETEGQARVITAADTKSAQKGDVDRDSLKTTSVKIGLGYQF
ncbi:MAG: hypothetical protein HQK53_18510 [Oligoflexia bacterium]|nr:hypothetical protein [Oligoflexia bacterium]